MSNDMKHLEELLKEENSLKKRLNRVKQKIEENLKESTIHCKNCKTFFKISTTQFLRFLRYEYINERFVENSSGWECLKCGNFHYLSDKEEKLNLKKYFKEVIDIEI